MILKANDTGDFNLSMNLTVDWDMKCIDVTVSFWDKKKKTTTAKTFPAEEFRKAIDCYDLQEKLMLSKEEEMARKMTEKRIERLAMDIRRFLLDKEMWIDVTIFFNGKAISTMSREPVSGHYEFGYNDETKLFVWENVDPKAYMEYCGGILSMTFEGPFHHAMNYGTAPEVEKGFRKLLAKYGCYMERGDHWNLSVFQG